MATPGENVDDEHVSDTAEYEGDAVERYENGRRRIAIHDEVIPDSLQHFVRDPSVHQGVRVEFAREVSVEIHRRIVVVFRWREQVRMIRVVHSLALTMVSTH